MTTQKRDTGKDKHEQSAEEPNLEQEEVGYGRPPKQHTIKPGEVRNPYGRRGKPRPEVDFLDEYVFVTVNGRRQKMTRRRALKEVLFREGMRGTISATKHLEQSAEKSAAKANGKDEGTLSAAEDKILERHMEKELQRRLKKRAGK
ncbi:MAG: hypothetical protein EPN75_00420 [Beijerinckiaceae bacterium]|nr:MAG: hypothetical protein EPN75_00420 [Beijerinckiaceae bacterium]